VTTYIALLRAINVGGKNLISMVELRKMLEGLGYSHVQSLLQSGNVVFQSEKKKPSDVETQLEDETKKRFGVSVDYMVRDHAELQAIVKANPFMKFAKEYPAYMHVLFLKSNAAKGAQDALRLAIKGREVVAVNGNVVYAQYPDGAGVSKLTNAVLEKHLGTRATGRNWNTVNKILQMAESMR